MSKPRDIQEKDLPRPPMVQIIDLGHPLARLAREIDWGFLNGRFRSVWRAGPRQPTRLVAGLMILKRMHSLSDVGRGVAHACWRTPTIALLRRGELLPQALPFERSSLTR